MNEIELQKLVIKEAFSKMKSLPDFGGIGNENAIKLRNYIWKVCGCLTEDDQASKATAGNQSKKHALVILYRLWSALTKNIRYIIDGKGKSVMLPRFGTFVRSQMDPQTVAFVPSAELANILETERPIGELAGESTSPEWVRIAPAA